MRHIPEFAFEFEPSDLEAEGQSNSVIGIDATYGWTNETGDKSWTFGSEFLVNDGDIGAEVDDNGTPAVPGDDSLVLLDDDVSGYYLWADHGWNERENAGVLYSAFEHPEADKPEDTELTLYYSRKLSEFSRVRFAVSALDAGEPGGDQTQFLVQWTNIIGAHGHGVNW